MKKNTDRTFRREKQGCRCKINVFIIELIEHDISNTTVVCSALKIQEPIKNL